MKRKFKVEFEVALSDSNVEEAIQSARNHYQRTGYASEPISEGSRELRKIPPEEHIPDIVSAIMELTSDNSLLAKARIEVINVCCWEDAPADAVLLR
jgi:hypothetical protein